MSLLGLLVALIVICVLFWGIRQVLTATGIGEPVSTIVIVLFVVIVVFYLLSQLGVGGGLSLGRL